MKRNVLFTSLRRYLVPTSLIGGFLVITLSSSTYAIDNYYWGTHNPTDLTKPTGAGRFGETRGKAGSTDYGHQGVDISVGGRLFAYADATVLNLDTVGGGGNQTVLQPKNRKDVVAVYWHQQSRSPQLRVGGEVKGGQFIGTSGNSGLNVSPGKQVHLHFGAGFTDEGKTLNIWLGNGSNSNSVIRGSVLPRAKTIAAKGKTYYWGNPALLLPMDVDLRSAKPTALRKYLGDSMRSQYNALAGNANAMPLGSGMSMGEAWESIPRLKVNYGGVPNDIATQNAQQGVVNVIVSDEEAERQLTATSEITPEQYAMYAPPRTFFTGESTVPLDIGDGGISENELIDKIGNARFANSKYQAELLNTSMRGMLTDYLNTINSKNYIKKAMLFQRQRIEALYATWNSQIVKKNLNGDLSQTIEKTQSATEIPIVSRKPLEDIYRDFDAGIAPTLTDLSTAIPISLTGKTSCHPNARNGWSNLSNEYKKQILILALKLGVDPNSFAILLAIESNDFSPSIYNRPQAAAGLIQLLPIGAGNMKMWNLLNKYFPETHTYTSKAFGTPIIKSEAKAMSVRPYYYIVPAKNASPAHEFMYYEAYFWSKSFITKPIAHKNLLSMYQSIFGNAVYISPSSEYMQNKSADVAPADGKVSAAEILLTDRFRLRVCNYYSDEDVLTNKYGITNNDLKIRYKELDGNIYQPTLQNLSGAFSVRLSAQRANAEKNNN